MATRSVVADRIRIEDEVWEEAFASRVRSRPPRTGQRLMALGDEPAEAPVRALEPRPAAQPDEHPRPTRRPDLVAVDPALTEAVAARRTIRIQGRGAERNLPVSSRQRSRPAHESAYFQPDKLAMWAVLLGFLLVAAALVSSHL